MNPSPNRFWKWVIGYLVIQEVALVLFSSLDEESPLAIIQLLSVISFFAAMPSCAFIPWINDDLIYKGFSRYYLVRSIVWDTAIKGLIAVAIQLGLILILRRAYRWMLRFYRNRMQRNSL